MKNQHCFICNKPAKNLVKVKQKANGPIVLICSQCKRGMDIVEYVTVETYLAGISGF